MEKSEERSVGKGDDGSGGWELDILEKLDRIVGWQINMLIVHPDPPEVDWLADELVVLWHLFPWGQLNETFTDLSAQPVEQWYIKEGV